MAFTRPKQYRPQNLLSEKDGAMPRSREERCLCFFSAVEISCWDVFAEETKGGQIWRQ